MELKLWVERSDCVPGARFTEVREMREGMRAWREKTSMILCMDSREMGYEEKLEEWFVHMFLETPWERNAVVLWNREEWERVREEITPSLKWPSYSWHSLTSKPAEHPPNIWKER